MNIRIVLAATMLGAFTAAGSANATSTSSAQQVVNDAVQTVHQLRKDKHFDNLLKQAKGVFIVPTDVKGALIVGGQGGQGVLLAREHGTWSDPAFLSIGSISIGPQAGGSAGGVVMILMTDKAMHDFIQANNFSLSGNAGLSIINYSAQGQAPVGKGDVIVWSNRSGAYAGLNVSGTDVTRNSSEDRNYYGREATTLDIVQGKVNNPSADPLRGALPG